MMKRKELRLKAEKIRNQAEIHVVHTWLELSLFLTNAAFVSVDVAGAAYVSRLTVTVEHPIDGVGVTLRTLSTGVTDTGIISMAEQA